MTNSMLCTHLPPTFPIGPVDHAVGYFGDLQLYRGGAWALTHPLTYGGQGLNGQGTNGMLHRGIGSPREWRGSLAVYTGPDWVFTAGTAGGTILTTKFYQPPPTFWHEWSRSILWIQGDVDTLVIFDRSHLDDPLALPLVGRYPDDTEKKFNAHPLRLWRWHAPVPPTIDDAAHTATWPIANGEMCRVSWLRADLAATITDQSAEWAAVTEYRDFELEQLAEGFEIAPRAIHAREKKFHLDLTPPGDVGFMSLITVIECGDPAHFSILTALADVEHGIQSVRLHSPQPPDWLVLFNALPGPKLPSYSGTGSYHPDIPGLLAPVRFRDEALPASSGARVWGMETATGLPMVEP